MRQNSLTAFFLLVVLFGGIPVFTTGESVPASGSNKNGICFFGVIQLSVEHYKEWNGWTPVLFSVGDLAVALWKDSEGRVFEMWGDTARTHSPVLILDANRNRVMADGQSYALQRVESGPLRTRFELLPGRSVIFLQWEPDRDGIQVLADSLCFRFNLIGVDVGGAGEQPELSFEGVNVVSPPGIKWEIVKTSIDSFRVNRQEFRRGGRQ